MAVDPEEDFVSLGKQFKLLFTDERFTNQLERITKEKRRKMIQDLKDKHEACNGNQTLENHLKSKCNWRNYKNVMDKFDEKHQMTLDKSLICRTMLVIGGCKLSLEREPLDSIEIIQQNHHSIFPTKLNIPVRGATSHVINGYLFVVGGCKGPKQHLNTVQLVQIDALIAEKKEEEFRNTEFRLNKERSCHISAYSEQQKKLFVLGGFDGWECLNCIEVLDLSDFIKKTMTEEKVENNIFEDFDNVNFVKFGKLPNELKNSMCIMNEKNQNIYTFGGWDGKNTLNSVWSISTFDCTYQFIGFLPHRIEGHAIVYISESGCVFIFGGYDGFAVTNRIMKFNMNTRASCVVDGETLSEARENLVAQRIDKDTIIVCSGWNGDEASSVIDTFKYDGKTDSIQRIDSDSDEQKLEIKRNRPTSVVI